MLLDILSHTLGPLRGTLDPAATKHLLRPAAGALGCRRALESRGASAQAITRQAATTIGVAHGQVGGAAVLVVIAAREEGGKGP